MTSSYRPDIDGLRAIAVLSVVAYHLSVPGIPGGYLGVDVFFVLSGFLITRIILTQIAEQTFSLLHFFERRIRRLLPALLLVLLVCTGFAIAVLLPADLVGYAKSLIATLLFSANIYFWRDTNYFSSNAEEKPLLHMWSLGVEEQFYILFPLLLLLLASRPQRQLIYILTVLVLLSFAANVGMNLIGGRNPAFFLLPTRAWELGLGAVLAGLRYSSIPRPLVAEGVGLIGVACIAAGLLVPDLLPDAVPESLTVVLGTAMVIWAGASCKTYIAGCLSLPPLRFVGNISYSLYLWHWPIIVFASYYAVRDLGLAERALAFLAMLILATFSLRLVEGPFRGSRMPFRIVVISLIAPAALLVFASVAILRTGGLPARLSEDAAAINTAVGTNYRCDILNYVQLGSARACRLYLPTSEPNEAQVVLYGNSHAQMYAPIIRDITQAQQTASVLLPMNGCLPFGNVNISVACAALAEQNLNTILALDNVTRVVIAFNWEIQSRTLVDASGGPIDAFDPAIAAGLDELLARLEAADIDVTVVGPIPVPGYELASRLSRSLAFGRIMDRPLSTPLPSFSTRYATLVEPLRVRLGLNFIEPHLAICDETTCNWIIEGRSIFSDSNHVSELELWRLRPLFDAALNP